MNEVFSSQSSVLSQTRAGYSHGGSMGSVQTERGWDCELKTEN